MWVLIAVNANAASWYVDKDAAGSNNGTSWANAWTTFGAVVWGGAGVVAGDTLFISGGTTSKDYGDTSITVGANGTSGNPITIRVGQDAGHTGTVIISKGGEGSTDEVIEVDKNYITVDGSVNGVSKLFIKDFFNTSDPLTANVFYSSTKTNVQIGFITASNVNNFFIGNNDFNYRIHNNTVLGARGDYHVRALLTSGAFGTVGNIVSNYFLMWYNGEGADGIQCGGGVDIWRNTFRVETTALNVSAQHPDGVQAAGSGIRIFDNDFQNVGDSHVDFDCWPSGVIRDFHIFNNVFRIDTAIDPFPDSIRMYSTSAALTTFSNVWIVGNTFIDKTNWNAILANNYQGGNPVAENCRIQNNIFYNVGRAAASIAAVSISSSSSFTEADWNFDYNVVNAGGAGSSAISIDGSTPANANGSGTAPSFTSYSAYSAANVLTLASATAADGNALSSPFDLDKVGDARGADGFWDIGAYEFDSSPDGPVYPQILSVPFIGGRGFGR